MTTITDFPKALYTNRSEDADRRTAESIWKHLDDASSELGKINILIYNYPKALTDDETVRFLNLWDDLMWLKQTLEERDWQLEKSKKTFDLYQTSC